MNGLELKISRLRAGMKQYQLARELGISQPLLSKYENDYQEPPPHVKEKLQEILGIEEAGTE